LTSERGPNQVGRCSGSGTKITLPTNRRDTTARTPSKIRQHFARQASCRVGDGVKVRSAVPLRLDHPSCAETRRSEGEMPIEARTSSVCSPSVGGRRSAAPDRSPTTGSACEHPDRSALGVVAFVQHVPLAELGIERHSRPTRTAHTGPVLREERDSSSRSWRADHEATIASTSSTASDRRAGDSKRGSASRSSRSTSGSAFANANR